MAAFDDCIKLVRASLPDFDEGDIREVLREIRIEQRGRNAEQIAALGEDRVQEAIEAGLEKVTTRRRALERIAALNAVRRIEIFNYLKNNWSDNPAKGLEAFMVGVQESTLTGDVKRLGSRRSVYAHQRERAVTMMNLFNSHLYADKKTGVSDITGAFARGDLTKNMGPAMDLLARSESEGLSVTPEAMKAAGVIPDDMRIAEAFREVNTSTVHAMNKAGAFVKNDPLHIIKNSHDADILLYRMHKVMTGKRGTTQQNYIAWRDLITEELDLERTLIEADILVDADISKRLQDSDPKVRMAAIDGTPEIADFFDSAYQAITSRVHYATPGWGDVPASMRNTVMGLRGQSLSGGANNLAIRMSQQRVFFFKSATAQLRYFDKAGRGNVREQIIRGIERNMFSVALMERMGPNALENFGVIRDTLPAMARASAKGGVNEHALARERVDEAESRIRLLNHEFMQLDGSAYIPALGGSVMAKIGAYFRAFEATTKLGSAVISAISDIEFYAASLRHNGRGFLEAYDEVLTQAISGASTEDQKAILRRLAVTYDGRNGMFESRLMGTEDPLGSGLSSRIMSQYFKWNLLTPWTDFLRDKAALTLAFDMAENTKFKWGQLDNFQKRRFTQYGITGEEWDAVYSGISLEHADGRNYLTPESVSALDDKVFIPFVAARLKKLGTQKRKELKALAERKIDADELALQTEIINEKFEKIRSGIIDTKREELRSKISTLIGDQVDLAILTPDARIRAIIQQGVQRGTLKGEAWMSAMQFKSFPLTVLQNVVGRSVSGNDGDFFRRGGTSLGGPLGKVKSLASGNGFFTALVQTAIMSTVFGYIAMQAKALTSGKTLRAPRTDEGNQAFLLDSAAILQASMMQGGSLGLYGDILFGDLRTRYGASAFEGLLGPAYQSSTQLWSVGTDFMNLDTMFSATTGDFSGVEKGRDSAARFVKQHNPLSVFYTKALFELLFVRGFMEAVNPGYTDRLNTILGRENNQALLGTEAADGLFMEN